MMSEEFQEIIDELHDARVFGFMFDSDRLAFKFDFYLYIQIFGDFEGESYELKKALLRFSDAEVNTLSIKNDLSRGQFFIVDVNVCRDDTGEYQFDFSFSSDDIKLNLLASNIEMLASEEIECSLDQYLKTNWTSLIKSDS